MNYFWSNPATILSGATVTNSQTAAAFACIRLKNSTVTATEKQEHAPSQKEQHMEVKSNFTWANLGLGKVRSLTERVGDRSELPADVAFATLRLSAKERYVFCFKTLVVQQEIWTIWDDDWLVRYGSQLTWVPVFPTEQIAMLSSLNDKNVEPIPIPVDDYVDQIIPVLAQENTKISISPSPDANEVVLLDWSEFLIDLVGAWEQENSAEAVSTRKFDEFAYQKIQGRSD